MKVKKQPFDRKAFFERLAWDNYRFLKRGGYDSKELVDCNDYEPWQIGAVLANVETVTLMIEGDSFVDEPEPEFSAEISVMIEEDIVYLHKLNRASGFIRMTSSISAFLPVLSNVTRLSLDARCDEHMEAAVIVHALDGKDYCLIRASGHSIGHSIGVNLDPPFDVSGYYPPGIYNIDAKELVNHALRGGRTRN